MPPVDAARSDHPSKTRLEHAQQSLQSILAALKSWSARFGPDLDYNGSAKHATGFIASLERNIALDIGNLAPTQDGAKPGERHVGDNDSWTGPDPEPPLVIRGQGDYRREICGNGRLIDAIA